MGPSKKLPKELGWPVLQVGIQGKDLVCSWVGSLAVSRWYLWSLYVMRKVLVFGIVGLSLLAGCMTGDMRAVSSSGAPASFKFSQGMSSDTYTAQIGDESFEGRAVMTDASTTFGTAFGSAYSTYGSSFGAANSVGFSSGGKFKAVMLGDKGSTLRCLMQYADSMGMTNFGGVGECVHSDGSRLDIVW